MQPGLHQFCILASSTRSSRGRSQSPNPQTWSLCAYSSLRKRVPSPHFRARLITISGDTDLPVEKVEKKIREIWFEKSFQKVLDSSDCSPQSKTLLTSTGKSNAGTEVNKSGSHIQSVVPELSRLVVPGEYMMVVVPALAHCQERDNGSLNRRDVPTKDNMVD